MAKAIKPVVFILLPQLDKPVFKGRVFVKQTCAVVENGQQLSNEEVISLAPDGFGIYQWRDDDKDHEAKLNAMETFMKKKNKGAVPFIIGPFDCREKALKAMAKKREKAPAEEAAILKTENQAQAKQIEELQKQIAEAQKAAK